MEVVLLERVARLGNVGDVVDVKGGFGRNYLVPQGKALRATEANKKRIETERAVLEKHNAERKAEAEKQSAKLADVVVTVVRQASEDGKLYGSVAVRDVATALAEAGHVIDARLIDLTETIKSLGLYQVTVSLHPDVPVSVKVHVARNADSPIPQELVEEEAPAAPVAQAAADESGEASDEALAGSESQDQIEEASASDDADSA